MRFYIFDLLHIDNENLMEHALRERRRRLEKEFTSLHGTLQLSPILLGEAHHALDTKTPADLMKQAESALQGNNFAYTAALFNQITEEYSASPQAKTVREL